MSGWLGDLEPNGPPRLSLAHHRSINGIAVGRNVIDLDGANVATTELAINRDAKIPVLVTVRRGATASEGRAWAARLVD